MGADLRRKASLLIFLLLLGCGRLSVLTPETLSAAREQWQRSGPSYYSMNIEMNGDRLETSHYEVTVRSKEVVKLLRNGQVVSPGGGRTADSADYSMDGLFHILDEEIGLAENPQVLGAPPGYASYPMATFDPSTGRLLRFQRSVGGAKNRIEIDVKDFKILGQ